MSGMDAPTRFRDALLVVLADGQVRPNRELINEVCGRLSPADRVGAAHHINRLLPILAAEKVVTRRGARGGWRMIDAPQVLQAQPEEVAENEFTRGAIEIERHALVQQIEATDALLGSPGNSERLHELLERNRETLLVRIRLLTKRQMALFETGYRSTGAGAG